MPKRFADQTLDAIAFNRTFGDALGYSQAETCVTPCVRRVAQMKAAAAQATAADTQCGKISRAAQPSDARQRG